MVRVLKGDVGQQSAKLITAARESPRVDRGLFARVCGCYAAGQTTQNDGLPRGKPVRQLPNLVRMNLLHALFTSKPSSAFHETRDLPERLLRTAGAADR